MFLVPIPDAAAGKAPAPEDAWRDLYAGMSRDAETQRLIRHLFGGVPTQFILLDADKEAAERALPEAPPTRRAVVLGVRPTPLLNETWRHPRSWTSPNRPGPETLEADKFVRCHWVSLDYAFQAELASLREEIHGGGVLILAVNEYLFRHRLGYQVCLIGDFGTQGGSADEVRSRLTGALEKHLERHGLPPLPKQD
jgi:hypothetical protein